VAGVEVWNSGTADVQGYQSQTNATHPLLLNGYLPMKNDYDADKNEYFIIDKNGVIQFHDSLTGTVWTWMVDTLVNRMISTIDRLRSSEISRAAIPARTDFGFYLSDQGDLSFTLPEPKCFSVEFIDARGRSLGKLPERTWAGGNHRLALSRMARNSSRTSAGMYFAVLKGPAFFRAIKVPIR
jgi:hypothetical protein